MGSGAVSSFDWSRISLGTRIAGTGAIVLLLAVFTPWVSVGPEANAVTGWSAFWLAKLAFLAAAVAIAVLVLEQVAPQVELPLDATRILLVCGGVGLFCTLWHLVFVPSAGTFAETVGVHVGRAFGVFLAAAAAGALTYGAWRRERES